MRKMLFGAVAGMSLVSSPAHAQFSYSDFSNTSGLQLNGSAGTAGSGPAAGFGHECPVPLRASVGLCQGPVSQPTLEVRPRVPIECGRSEDLR